MSVFFRMNRYRPLARLSHLNIVCISGRMPSWWRHISESDISSSSKALGNVFDNPMVKLFRRSPETYINIPYIYMYINLRRLRDCSWMFVALCVALWQLRASFTYFGDLLRCPDKRIVTITKVYIARNNQQVQFIRFHQKSMAFIHVYFCEARGLSDHSMFAAYSLDGSNWPRTN